MEAILHSRRLTPPLERDRNRLRLGVVQELCDVDIFVKNPSITRLDMYGETGGHKETLPLYLDVLAYSLTVGNKMANGRRRPLAMGKIQASIVC